MRHNQGALHFIKKFYHTMNQIVRAEDDTAATTPCPKFDLEFVAATSNGGDSENKFELIKREKNTKK